MGTFVIVHGAWGGGWEWSAVVARLRSKGHQALAPTLTGLGDRCHLLVGERVGLATHIDDVVAAVEFEQLSGVVLCGASYGGMAVTGAAEHLRDRVRSIVYIDALVPCDGQSALDLLPGPFVGRVRQGIVEHGESWRLPIPADLQNALVPPGALPDDIRHAYLSRLRDHPAASFAEPVALTGAVERLSRAFIRCTTAEFGAEVGVDPIADMASRTLDQGWPYREIETRHDPQLFAPDRVADLIEELGTQAAL